MHRLLKRMRTALVAAAGLGLLACFTSAGRAQVPGPIQVPAPIQIPAPVLGTPAGPAVAGSLPVPVFQVMVPLGAQVRFQMSTKRDIEKIFNPKNTSLLVSVRPELKDATTVFLTGLTPDIVRAEFVDIDGRKELYDFVVQLDVEFVKMQLRRTVQASNLQVVATGANTVLVTGTVTQPQDIELINRVVQSIGALQVINAVRVGGVQQVQLDVVVAQVSRREFRRMAFDFLTNSSNFFLGNTVGQSAVTPSLIGTGGSLSVGPGISGAPGAPGGGNTNVVFGVLYNPWGILGFLQALREEGLVKTLAEPRLVTLSGRPASFLAGGEQAIPVPAGLGQVGIQFSEFGTRLNFLPIVLGNGKIHLEVEPEVSNLDPNYGTNINGTVVPGRNTSRVNTTVQLEPGQTFVIGGLIQNQVLGNSRRVPFLGDFPVLNFLFSSKGYEEQETELVVLVTPHLVDAMDCQQAPKKLPGQETRSPDDFELFLEGILEAPRGPRKIWDGYRYVPAYKNGPTAGQFPCTTTGGCPAPGAGPAPVSGGGVLTSPPVGVGYDSVVPGSAMPTVGPVLGSPPVITTPGTLPPSPLPGQPLPGSIPQAVPGPGANPLPLGPGPGPGSSPPPGLPSGIE